jgi:uncharacterized protein YbbK (DUF523 family)
MSDITQENIAKKMKYSLNSLPKVKLLLSSCLLGEKVRYDGASKPQLDLMVFFQQTLKNDVQIISYCPEVSAGFSTPRPAIQRQFYDGQLRILLVDKLDNGNDDKTDALEKAIQTQLENTPSIQGAILKSRSPSCGIANTPWFDEQGNHISTGEGIWAQALLASISELFAKKVVVNETINQGDQTTVWWQLYVDMRLHQQYQRAQEKDEVGALLKFWKDEGVIV